MDWHEEARNRRERKEMTRYNNLQSTFRLRSENEKVAELCTLIGYGYGNFNKPEPGNNGRIEQAMNELAEEIGIKRAEEIKKSWHAYCQREMEDAWDI